MLPWTYRGSLGVIAETFNELDSVPARMIVWGNFILVIRQRDRKPKKTKTTVIL